MMFTHDQQPARRENYESFEKMLAWVEEHIGPMTEKYGFTQPVIRKGDGWEIRTTKKSKLNGNLIRVIGWHMHIDDDHLATMFALKFVN